jgi:hypothetical protein
MASYSSGSGYSQNTSIPVMENSAQSNWADQLSQELAGIGQNQLGWAQNAYNQGTAVTDQQIDQYNANAGMATGEASNLLGRYENTFEPIENQYVSEAGSYASPGRVQQNMGAAESGVNQAENQNAINAEQQLQSYGIDPSSGRYQELVQSQKAGAGAAEAGAGQQAMLATTATQRQMEQNAIAMGQQIPGATVNALNAASQDISGAENSELGQENAGVNEMDSANPYFQSAMSLKYPGSSSMSMGHSANANESANNGGSSGGGSNPSSPGGQYQGAPGGMGGPLQGPGNGEGDPSLGGNYGGGNYGGGNGTQGGTIDTSSDQALGDMQGGGGGGGGGYAAGGEVGVMPTSGGHVPPSASPSGGQMTDDIPARLNAREFVIPQDVADWKGQEFFQKLIEQSRKARQGAPAAGQDKAPLPNQQRPTFVSHKLPPAGVKQPGQIPMQAGMGAQ